MHPAEVVGNPLRIEQVIVNFVGNAIRYTPAGRALSIKTMDEGESIRVCVENEGAHIPDDQLEKIWDRFYRIEQSRDRATGGTGLGLAISRRILELHEAPYGVENTADGVLFYFSLRKSAA